MTDFKKAKLWKQPINFLNNLKNTLGNKYISVGIIAAYDIASIMLALFFYPLNPFIMNYFPGTAFISNQLRASITIQYVIFVSIYILINTLILNRALKGVAKCKEYLDNAENFQEKEKEYVRKLQENQELMLQQERLASLGQMIGGITHNMKTPIMSMAGGIEALRDLIQEYDDSIGDSNVTDEDHHAIAAEMNDWIHKMKPYLSYMSDIISAVKGQAVTVNEASEIVFGLKELIERVRILMKYELSRNECIMDMDVQVETDVEFKGEINSLVQVINNLISNAIEAYEGKRGKIDFRVYRDEGNIEFMIRDYGKGIPEEVKDRLFKEMLTTKGKKGTGLGLYMSYLAITTKFSGNMRFESEEGKGTTFYISIPV